MGAPVGLAPKDHGLDVTQLLDVPEAPDHEFPLGHLQDHGTHVLVGRPDGLHDLVHRNAEAPEPIRVQGDLVGPLEASHRGHLAHPGDGVSLVAKEPVLDGSEVGQGLGA